MLSVLVLAGVRAVLALDRRAVQQTEVQDHQVIHRSTVVTHPRVRPSPTTIKKMSIKRQQATTKDHEQSKLFYSFLR